MLLGYVDESYNRDFYYMVALLCPENTLQHLAGELDAVTTKAAEAHNGIAPEAELHGYELFHGKGDSEALSGKPRARIAVYRDVFTAIAAYPVHVIVRGVDRNRLLTRYGDRADERPLRKQVGLSRGRIWLPSSHAMFCAKTTVA